MSNATDLIETIPTSLLREPLEWLFAEHYRHRQLCLTIDRIAGATVFDEAPMRMVVDFIQRELALHIMDEEEDFFPLLRRRCLPEDGIEEVLGVLAADHRADIATAADVLALLERALTEQRAPGLDLAAQRTLRAFSEQERRHLALENAVVLPIARLRFSASDLKALSDRLAARRGLVLSESVR